MSMQDAVRGEGRKAGLWARPSLSTWHGAGMDMPLRGGTKRGVRAVARLPATAGSWLHSLPPDASFCLHHDLMNSGFEPLDVGDPVGNVVEGRMAVDFAVRRLKQLARLFRVAGHDLSRGNDPQADAL